MTAILASAKRQQNGEIVCKFIHLFIIEAHQTGSTADIDYRRFGRANNACELFALALAFARLTRGHTATVHSSSKLRDIGAM